MGPLTSVPQRHPGARQEFPPRKGSGWLLRVPHLILYGPTTGLEHQGRERPATTTPLPPFPPALGMTSWWGKGGEGGGRRPRTPPFPPPSPLFPQRGGRAVQPRRGGPGAVACVGGGVLPCYPHPGRRLLRLRVPVSARPSVCVPRSSRPPRPSRPVGTVPTAPPSFVAAPRDPRGAEGNTGRGGGPGVAELPRR